jgi:anaerobic magnesium-protoporphyrin IX monomethyl ester cyclase
MNIRLKPPEGLLLDIRVPERFVFFNPPSKFLTDERVFMPLGPLKVAASLEERGAEVEFVDCSGIRNYLRAMEHHLRTTKATFFGFTATTPQLPQTVKMMKLARALRPDATIILGGPHVTLAHAAHRIELHRGITDGRAGAAMRRLLKLTDVIIAGDGEDAVFAACHPDAPKLIDADLEGSQFRLSKERLNQTRWPARHLVDRKSYRYTIDGFKAISLIAQLGCPFECGFCGGRLSHMLRRPRTRTILNIIAEVEFEWRAEGKPHEFGVMFYDDELNIIHKDLLELMRAIRALQDKLSAEEGNAVEFRLRGFIKSNLFNDEQAKAMFDAGFRWLLIGFESGSEKILRNINKKADRADNTRCVEIAKRHGLKIKALMSIGHPGESPETIEETHQWLRDMAALMNAKAEKNFDFDLTVITCYLGTPYYDDAVYNPGLSAKHGWNVWTYTFTSRDGKSETDVLHQIALDYTKAIANYKGKPGQYKAYVFTDTLLPGDIVELREKVNASVRAEFGIPEGQGLAQKKYERSMGQGDVVLPDFILRSTAQDKAVLPA